MTDDKMIPQTGTGIDPSAFAIEQMPGYTYRLDETGKRIVGFADGVDALAQAIYIMLSTERGEYLVYSDDYGVELADLVGKPIDYVTSEVKRRVTDALTQDDRVNSLDDWKFEQSGRMLCVSFVVRSVYGDVAISKEVSI